MSNLDERLERIRTEVENHFQQQQEEFTPGQTPIRLSRPTFGSEEVVEAIESLLSTWVTMGDKVEQFEREWADYVGVNHATMVNSGSSANLLAMKALAQDHIDSDDEIIVPAVSWSTSLFPILDIGAKPVLVDVDPETYTIDVESLNEAITEKTAGIVPVHLLGNPCEMNPILELVDDHDLAIMEDCCEAHGAEYRGQKVGTFGDMGTFSFFFSHHISTIEGGMIVTNQPEYRDRTRMARAHGWVRDIEDQSFSAEHSEIDERFLFAAQGYNLRPTEIQGAFGIHQLEKLEPFVEKRRENASYLNEQLEQHDRYFDLLNERNGTRCSWFAYPLLIKEPAPFSRNDLQDYLEDNLIETRPILAGDLTRQPVMNQIPHRIHGDLAGSRHLHFDGLFIGNHHALDQQRLNYIVETITTFVENTT
ncbi:DegT/DnrJ/EryC1/StrS family aminotransferase [Haladaptatus pallidirubidus]|uniref:Lipopolysaccharide biosynthesis protein RfbH n=1 Tax=Haladaptatus pallidirubidus TaxID=1008152 RepID=A0AAV3UPB4_9EURY|nr:aminotransferase class I/II-fold pyridoxal phosphate-dependent enzyme [Haladaptatus pallidirubidus]